MNVLHPTRTTPGAANRSWFLWAQTHLQQVREQLTQEGALWLRGLQDFSPDLAQRLVELVGGGPLMDNVFWSTPRSRITDKTFTATEYPARAIIPLHSEMSYRPCYPRLLCFHALQCADSGGQTSVADLRAVSVVLDEVTSAFHHRGVCYVRVFHEGMDIPLSTAFGSDDLDEIARRAREQGMELTPRSDGSTRLTHQGRGALLDTDGIPLWFNQANLLHAARLPAPERHHLTVLFGADDLPRQALFADGTPIPDVTIHTVNDVFAQYAQEIAWQPGDVLLVDNQRYAHGRLPFTGHRRLHVAMGLPCTDDHRTVLFT
ncbi:TauD/TfdA family dioxygenase [Streptomyces sp. NPDC006285]|uniref:TauD/TfdA family dioxygenase n=1 Tax=Streptomyces sp. NPDC006285 TaxID=3364742 RepID=UPI0036C39DDF